MTTTDAMTRATDAISTKMQALNAELREQGRIGFRRTVAECVNRPDLFLERSAWLEWNGKLTRFATADAAARYHARRARIERAGLEAKARGEMTVAGCRNRLATHEQIALIARYLRRFGDRAGTQSEAA